VGLLAAAVSALLQLGAQRACGQRLGVELVLDRQQLALLGHEQEHEPHHHHDRAAVDLFAAELRKQLSMSLAILVIERCDQQLHRAAHLRAELVGDLLLAFGAFAEQRT
jgi:hypothetical protein